MEETKSPRKREIPKYPLDFLASSWNFSPMDISKKIFSLKDSPSFINFGDSPIKEDTEKKLELPFPPLPDASPTTSGRPSHSSDTLSRSQSGASLNDGAPLIPSLLPSDDFAKLTMAALNITKPKSCGGSKNVSHWLKECREKKKEATRAQNAQIHAAISIAALSAAVSAATTRSLKDSNLREKNNEEEAKMRAAIASASTLVAAHCVEAAEAIGAEHDLLASVVESAVRACTSGDLVALTAASVTALRGNATLKSRALKEVWNVAAILPLDKGSTTQMSNQGQQPLHQVMKNGSISHQPFTSDLLPEDFLAICSQELLSQGAPLLKRTQNGALHWKNVSSYINSSNKVMLKMKSNYVAGTISKKKKYVVKEVCKDIVAWPGRHLLEGERHYFGVKTLDRGIIEFECNSHQDYQMWIKGISRLLHLTSKRSSS